MNNYAIDTAARFGDIPFVEFTRELVTGIFDSLVEAHILQMEEFADFTASLTQDLSTYINNTQDNVTFDQIAEFITNYDLPELPDLKILEDQLKKLELPKDNEKPKIGTTNGIEKWWGGLINALAPVVSDLVSKIDDPSEHIGLEKFKDYNDSVIQGVNITASKIPSFKEIHGSIAALIASNKYGLLQNMAKQGMMRLVVTEGEIETKITFSTWNSSSRGNESGYKRRAMVANKMKQKSSGGILGLFRKKKKNKHRNRTVTVNTAKSYQRDTSGTRVDIFGRVLIRFKTDYAPLNG